MIFSDLGIHDKKQFELELEYLIEGKKTTRHNLDVFYVFPNNLDVNTRTFRSQQFYESLQNYIRIKVPEHSLVELNNSNAPIYDDFKNVNTAINKNDTKRLIQALKLFACILESTIKSHYLKTTFNSPHLVDTFLNYMQNAMLNFRRSGESLKNGESKKINRVFKRVDEHNSITLEHYHFSLLETLKRENKNLFDEMKPKILSLIKGEQAYRKNYFSDSVTGNKKQNEAFLSAKNSLKKYVQSVLFLNKEDTRQSRRLEQLAFAIAAGVAMVFATGMIVLLRVSTTHISYTTFSLFVLSYMFKDRIKDWVKNYFQKKLQNRFFDYITTITTEEDEIVAKIKRNFKFINKSDLPKYTSTDKPLSWMPKLELSWGMHTIVYYQNQIEILNSALKNSYSTHKVTGIVEIFRFNIEPFAKKIDDSNEEIFVLSKNDYKGMKTMRTYHFYLIVNESGEGISFSKLWKIEFNRAGVQSVSVVEG
jgi:hypothetical protein